MKRIGPRPIIIALAALLLLDLGAVMAYLAWCDASVARNPVRSDHDVGVLFFAGFDADDGLDREGRTRVDQAAMLFHAGRIAKLICIGGRRHDPERYGAELMADRLRGLGVPDHALRVDRQSFDTLTNWREAVAILRAEGWRQPLLISGPLHLARIRHIAREPFPIALSPARTVWQQLADQPLRSWAIVHLEWAAWAAMGLLSPDTHRGLVERWRNFWD